MSTPCSTGAWRAVAGERAPGDSRPGALARAVDGSGTLLVVDGVGELAGLADTMTWLYEETSDTRCVVTARAPLGIAGEHVVRLGPLPVPRPGSPLAGPALDLCLDRVAAAGGSPIDLAEDGDTLRHLLLATGGLPLLIEQLAAQVAVVGVANAAPTHSMAQALDASVALLDEDRSRCFFRLAQLAEPVGPRRARRDRRAQQGPRRRRRRRSRPAQPRHRRGRPVRDARPHQGVCRGPHRRRRRRRPRRGGAVAMGRAGHPGGPARRHRR